LSRGGERVPKGWSKGCRSKGRRKQGKRSAHGEETGELGDYQKEETRV